MNKLIMTSIVVALGLSALLAMTMESSDNPRFSTTGNPIELGEVAWERDLDKGLARAKKLGRDVFLLFQEVPG